LPGEISGHELSLIQTALDFLNRVGAEILTSPIYPNLHAACVVEEEQGMVNR
jgi:hypothetical protein